MSEASFFISATPVWSSAPQIDKNQAVVFSGEFNLEGPQQKCVLRVTGWTSVRAWINGQFCFYGPARTAKGHFRIEDVDISDKTQPGLNRLVIEVVNYGVETFSNMKQPPFLAAEILSDDNVLLATGHKGWTSFVTGERVAATQRFSYMRGFSEVYRFEPGASNWEANKWPGKTYDTVPAQGGAWLPRRTPPSTYACHPFVAAGPSLSFMEGTLPPNHRSDRSLDDIGGELEGFPFKELYTVPFLDWQKMSFAQSPQPTRGSRGVTLKRRQFQIFDFGQERTGLFKIRLKCSEPTRLWLAWDEIFANGRLDPLRMSCVNFISMDLPKGEKEFLSAEPYGWRYCGVYVMEGSAQTLDIEVVEMAHPEASVQFQCSDPEIEEIFAAAIQTCRQNSWDYFVDCPHRERGGYLCDSFFTSRAAYQAFGGALVEQAFFENFALPDHFEGIPVRMTPMLYPSDALGGTYIPQWPMWMAVQALDFRERDADDRTLTDIQPRLQQLLEWLAPYENELGLLEKLPGWNFVEWSKANDYVQDVSFPTNMLYSHVLDAYEELYGGTGRKEKAKKIREVVLEKSFDGTFFRDHALRKLEGLVVQSDRSEVCQYFAFFFKVATPESHPELYGKLLNQFGPGRKANNRFPEVDFANAFIGNYLRMALLTEWGQHRRISQEIKGYFLKMAQTTGTLWENDDAAASCNHGFASYALAVILQSIVGLGPVKARSRTVAFSPPDVDLEWAKATVQSTFGPIEASWTKSPHVASKINHPSGLKVVTES